MEFFKNSNKLGLLICLMTIFIVLSCTSFVQASEEGYFSYTVTDGKAEITSYSPDGPKEVVIPAKLGGYPVTSIKDAPGWSDGGIFSNLDITSVEFPTSLNYIGRAAFRFNKLTYVNIPISVTSLGEGVFSDNQLIQVSIPESVTSIGNGAFYKNELTQIMIPNSVTSIGACAFSDNKLTQVTIPDGVTSIDIAVFSNNHLTQVSIPESVISIGNNAFYKNELTQISIPNNVTSIGAGAFAGNQLTLVVIPDSVTSIGNAAFSSNKIIYILLGNSVKNIGDYAFYNNQLSELNIPEGVTSIGEMAFSDNQITQLSLPTSVTNIGRYAFQNNRLTSIIIPDSVMSIDHYVFANNQLTSISIPKAVTSIGNHAFYNNQLTTVSIAEGVKSIGCYAFYSNQLTQVSIPNGVTSIGYDAFANNKLTQVSIPNNLTKIEGYVFYNNQLTQVDIPTSVTSIDDCAFSRNKLTQITIPNSVKTIGTDAFYNNQLTSVTIPDSVTSMGEYAFSSNKLSEVTIYGKNVVIGANAFASNQSDTTKLNMYGVAGSTTETYAKNNNHTFLEIPETLYTITINPPVNGNLTLNKTSANFNDLIILTITPDHGYGVDELKLNGITKIPTANIYAFNMPGGNIVIDVTFKRTSTEDGHAISLSVQPVNSGTVTGQGYYADGINVTVTATANQGYSFIKWTENGTEVSTNASYTFTANKDRNLTAEFQILAIPPNCPTNVVVNAKDLTYPGVDGRDFTVSWTPSSSLDVNRQMIMILPVGATVPSDLNLLTPVAIFDNNTTCQWTGDASITMDSNYPRAPLKGGEYEVYVIAFNPYRYNWTRSNVTVGFPVMPTEITAIDNDLTYPGVDGRDFTVNWIPSASPDVTCQMIGIFPVNAVIPDDINLLTPVATFYDNTTCQWTGDESITMDSNYPRQPLKQGAYIVSVLALNEFGYAYNSSNTVNIIGEVNVEGISITGQAKSGMQLNINSKVKSITRAELCKLLTLSFSLYDSNANATFNDVSSTDSYYHYIASAFNANLLRGYPDGCFKPYGTVTRAEYATVITHFLGYTNNQRETIVTDISNHWAQSYIEEAINSGIMCLYPDNSFKPDASMTINPEAQLIAIINPPTAPDKSIVWTSSDNSIASIDQSGQVTGKKAGSVVINATTNSGNKTATYNIEIVTETNTDTTLQAIKINGSDLNGFSSTTETYNVELPYGTTTIPEVKAVATDTEASVVITPATALPGTTEIEVTAKDGLTIKTYKLSFSVAIHRQVNYKVYINGNEVISDIGFYELNNVILSPIRYIAEYMDLQAVWDAEKQQVTLSKDDKLLVMTVNSTKYTVNGSEYQLPVSPTIIANRVMVPLQVAVEAFGGKISIDTGVDECFIATAAFGSKFTWPVTLLRDFRDQYLLTNSWGTAFVSFYYQNSPPIATIIGTSQPLKILVRVLLAPIIALVYLLYHPTTVVILLTIGILLSGFWFIRRRYLQIE